MALKTNKAIFLDRDGVILKEGNFQIDYTQTEFIPRAVEAIRNIPGDFRKVIISNQSGIARGYFTIGQVDDFNGRLMADLRNQKAVIDAVFFCPHGPDDNCECRKPGAGLFEKAQRQLNINFAESWVIGDKSSDIQAGKNIGARTILVLTGYAGREPGAANIMADHTAGDLFEAVEILKQ